MEVDTANNLKKSFHFSPRYRNAGETVMEKVEPEVPLKPQNANIKAFADFIQQLNIFRRHLVTYPENHPALNFTAEKVLGLVPDLFLETETVQCAVIKKALILNGNPLDPKNMSFRDFATALSSKGIVLLSFKKGLSSRELSSFCQFLNQAPEEIMALGGVQNALKQKKLQCIQAQKMDYSAFQIIAGGISEKGRKPGKEPESLWERFANSLINDTLGLTGGGSQEAIFEPAQLAEFLNQKLASATHADSGASQKNLEFLLARFEREGADGYFYYVQALENFTKFIENLSPELRSQLMKGVFRHSENRQQSVEKVLKRLSTKTIVDILNDISSENTAVSQTVFSLLSNLSKGSEFSGRKKKTYFDDQVEKKLKSLFKEDINERFLNQDYQHTLDSLVNHDTRASKEILKEVPCLEEELSIHKIERQLGQIVLELLHSSTDPEFQKEIKKNIVQSLNYFLETSDFAAIQKIHDRLAEKQAQADSKLVEFYRELLQIFEQPDFTAEILVGLNTWNKEKLEEIQTLVQSVGYPFVPALLKQLAEESKRTTRRFILEQLYRIAPLGPIDPILKWLNDGRWYVIRNMILLLRTLGNTACVEHLEKLIVFPHPKVRFEIIKTFLHFQHPLGSKFLLEDLSSSDNKIRFSAIFLAEYSRAPVILDKLLELLNKGGFKTVDLDTKRQIVRTLGAIKQPAALPILKKILNSFSLFNPAKTKELKLEIKRSLSCYPANAVRDIIGKAAETKDEDRFREAERAETSF